MNRLLFAKARIAKDKNFDGKFFFGVKTTGIFCRPSCPSPIAKEQNVEYFESMFLALEQGYRPCLRCRPDLNVEYYNSNIDGATLVNTALGMIYDGYLNDKSIRDLANELFISDRHLRKLFVDNLGIPPVKIAKYHKALFAKKLLLLSDLSITNICYASGFGSTRQFNGVIKEIFGFTPTEIRKAEPSVAKQNNTTLLLNYKHPVHFKQILSYLKLRQLTGVEVITDNSYSRTFRINEAKGYFLVRNNIKKSALELTINCNDIKAYMPIVNRVRKMFDLNTDFSLINREFSKDSILIKGMNQGQVPHLPVSFNPFEVVIRAILGQQITVKAATTLATRVAKEANIKTNSTFPAGLNLYFPNPNELNLTNITGIGITKTRQATIKNIIHAMLNNDFTLKANQSYEKFFKEFTSVKGIGSWTANYVAMRGLGMVDSFPASDLWIIRALSANKQLSKSEILKIAEKWRPYRAYSALCLWNYMSNKEQE